MWLSAVEKLRWASRFAGKMRLVTPRWASQWLVARSDLNLLLRSFQATSHWKSPLVKHQVMQHSV